MTDTILFTAKATAIGGREGSVKSEDGALDYKLAMPGSGKDGANPEQFFAAGYSACFGSALSAVAKSKKMDIAPPQVTAEVALRKSTDGKFSLAAALDVRIEGLSQGETAELVQAAHHVCPYSKATRGNMPVTLKVQGQEIDAGTGHAGNKAA